MFTMERKEKVVKSNSLIHETVLLSLQVSLILEE